MESALESPTQGRATLARLERMNLFLTPMDARGEWYRYHQSFRELLQRELQARSAPSEIAALHRQASEWFGARGLMEEALKHALAAEDLGRAVDLVEQNIQPILNHDEWRTLERWLNLLPETLIPLRPALLLARAWILHFQNKPAAIPPLLTQVEEQLCDTEFDPTIERALHGEIDALRAQELYWRGEIKQGQRAARRALDNLPATAYFARSLPVYYLALYSHIAGQSALGVRMLNEIVETESEPSNAALLTRALLGLVSIHVLNGDLDQAALVAERMLHLAEQHHMMVVVAWAHYALGNIAYIWNELDVAHRHFSAVSAQRYFAHTSCVHECLSGLALTYQAQNQTVEAQKTLQDLAEFAFATNNTEHIQAAQALKAQLALARGDVETARALFGALASPLMALTPLNSPCLVQVAILFAQGDKPGFCQAAERLQTLEQDAETLHSQMALLSVLVMQALAYDGLGKKREALEVMQRAIAIGQPCHAVRAFLDLGAPMARLLRELRERGIAHKYIGSLLAAFAASQSLEPESASQMMNPEAGIYDALTERELQVLKLMAQRYSDREIAQTLHISPFTVHSHVNNIYSKLDVHDRRGVAAKAKALKLLE
ncbi:MAG: hypothetical protein HY741_28605 [Chloroflexi bacterium]|nr:hypothetical protein [Chloroflexota bacterium]